MISNFLLYLGSFVLVLAPLVFFHELGHFLAAKSFRVGVPVFSIGFGPRLFGFRYRETDYRLSLIPLGGFVRMSGDEADENRTGASHEFLAKPRWQRFVVYVAGATFNVILAFVVMWTYFGVFGKAESPQTYPVVWETAQDSQAEQAGILPGDRILEIAGRDVRGAGPYQRAFNLEIALAPQTEKPLLIERDGNRREIVLETGSDPEYGGGNPGWIVRLDGQSPGVIGRVFGDPAMAAGLKAGDRVIAAGGKRPVDRIGFQLAIRESPGQPVDLTVVRDGAEVDLRIVPDEVEGVGNIGVEFAVDRPPRRDLGLAEAAGESWRTNLEWSKTLFVVIKRLFTRELPLQSLSSPIGIAQIARQAFVAGPETFLFLLGFFSLQLGILNLLPIPVLDGGHILILLVESVMRRELSERLKERVMQMGLAFLLVLMAVILFKDAVRLF